MAAALPGNQLNIQGVAFRDRGGQVLDLDSDELGIQNIGGVFKQVNPNGSSQPLGGGSDPGVLVTLGGDTADWDMFTGLTGDIDGDYDVSINVIADLTGRTYTLMPNGANPTSSNGTYFYSNTGAITANANQANSLLVGISNSGLACEIRFRIESKSGRARIIFGTFFTDTSAAAGNIPGWFQYNWLDTATVLTSLRLHSSAGVIKAASTARIQKRGFLA